MPTVPNEPGTTGCQKPKISVNEARVGGAKGPIGMCGGSTQELLLAMGKKMEDPVLIGPDWYASIPANWSFAEKVQSTLGGDLQSYSDWCALQ